MSVFKLTFPGWRLKSSAFGPMDETELILRQMENQFKDAVLALNLYQQEVKRSEEIIGKFRKRRTAKIACHTSLLNHLIKWITNGSKRAGFQWRKWINKDDISGKANAALKVFSASDFLLWRQNYEYRLLDEQWKSGTIPEKYQRNIAFIYAHAYLYALDSLSKSFRVLANNKGVPPKVKQEYLAFKSTFPDLTAVRDSAHHMEDRLRMVDRKGNKITPQSNIILLGTILGGKEDELSYLSEDGRNVTIEISSNNIEDVRSIFQNVIYRFEWNGVPRLEVY